VPKRLTRAPVSFRLFEGAKELAPEDQPLQRVRRTGEAILGWQGRLQTSSGRSAYVMISATPLFADDGQLRGAIAAIVDVSEHKQAEEHQQMLLDELQHRVKNILATVHSLVIRMAKTTRSVGAFLDAFVSRIAAMSRVHDLLVESSWRGASLKSLAAAALEPYMSTEAANVRLSGPDITLAADTAATMGMVLNELATNAAKYGALSTPGGKVDVAWETLRNDDLPRVHLNWTERDGPAVDPGSASGFGTSFITRSVEYELNGTAALELAPTGLRCTIEFPLATRAAFPARRGDADVQPS
jgi:two-component system CheB/CheR fusion protein